MHIIKAHWLKALVVLILALTLFNTYAIYAVNSRVVGVYTFLLSDEYPQSVLSIVQQAIEKSQSGSEEKVLP
jgi:hypothetical protein